MRIFFKDVVERVANTYWQALVGLSPIVTLLPWWVPFACAGIAAAFSLVKCLVAYHVGDKAPRDASLVKLKPEG